MTDRHRTGTGRETALRFAVRAWAAWAGGLQTQQDWHAWAAAPHLPPAQPETPALPQMAAMLRRRLPPLGRVALAPAYACVPADAEAGAMPAIFASRHGDTGRLVTMLSELAVGDALSPTAFGLSVHNAIGAVRSIDVADPGNLQALSAGRDTVETAVLEACSLLADGAPEVLLVHYEAPLAAPYTAFADEAEALYGWCWRLAAPRGGEPCYTLALADSHDTDAAPPPSMPLPHGLEVLRFMLAGEPRLRHRGESADWQWQRHG